MSNDDKRGYKGGPIITAVVAVVLLLPLAYVGSYFGLSRYSADSAVVPKRSFKSYWQVRFFWPALKIEKRFRGQLLASGEITNSMIIDINVE